VRLFEDVQKRTDELSEALEQQTATSEVLKVISSSPGDLEPIFQSLLENAIHICGAKFGNLWLREGDLFRVVAAHGVPAAYREMLFRAAIRPGPDTGLGMLLKTKRFVQIDDITKGKAYLDRDPLRVATVELGGGRTLAEVPLVKDGELIGSINIYHQEVKPFTEKQIELLTNFATQAVIAIENTRLLNELRQRTDDLTESLEQQTATSEVLKVISSSPGDLEPVFQAMLENATRICEAAFGTMFRFDGKAFYLAAGIGTPPALAELQKQRGAYLPESGTLLDRVLQTREVAHSADYAAEPNPGNAAKLGGARSTVCVPMLKEDELIGVILIYRQEVRPFTDKQIELVTNFAAQAVIAIENTRLLNELRQRTDDLTESLEQQTATSEVLQVISTSPGDLEPVFQSMMENAIRICTAEFGVLYLYDGNAYRVAAAANLPPAIAAKLQGPLRPGEGTAIGRVAKTMRVAHIVDLPTEQVHEEDLQVRMVAAEFGIRTLLAVPMIKDGRLVGAISIFRKEVQPFSDKQIELLTNFAAQAVIAIENTRLLNELRESLQQQTATAEVLKVISSSPGDLHPVFNAMLANATQLCSAKFGILYLFEGNGCRTVAMHDVPPAFAEQRGREPFFYPPAGSPLGRVVRTRQVAHIADITTEQGYAEGHRPLMDLAELGGARTVVAVPMLKDGEVVGAVTIYRQEVRPFTDKQIELVQNFAAQAIIAIENTRLLNELRESLAQQTATADVLKVISRSTFDLQTVLNTLVESAARLCRADRTAIRIARGGLYHHVSDYGFLPDVSERMMRDAVEPSGWSMVGRVLAEGKAVHIIDAQADPDEGMARRARVSSTRSILGVPLMREGSPIGVLLLQRSVIQPFTDKQIALATTFADQASIAIENVRLFDEIQDKSRQLAEASQHKSQFLANMSHELRTPLNAILGYTELIVDGIYGAPSDKMHDVLKRIESNGRHLLGLINDVLDLSKIEAGQLTLALSDYSLKDVVQTVFSAVEPLATEKQIALKIDVSKDLPPGRGDERRLTQVLLNLVGNAIKFTDEGEVVIAASAANGSFKLAVRDTGPGISAADQAKLFQEFQQADNSITRKKGGTGLGLAISKRIVELHGGRIWVESSPGRGSTFAFTLPVMVENPARQ
jgi:signal transduction histidine kinase/uncharacterized membrane protein